MYKRTIKGEQYVLYKNEEEFYKHNPKKKLHEDWRTAQKGDWIKSDDGKVTMVIKRGYIDKLNKDGSQYIRTLLGMVNCNKTKFFGGEPVKDIWRFGKVSWYQKTLDGSLSTQKRIFAKYIASGIEPLEAYKKAYPKCTSELYAKQRIQVLLKSEKVKKLIDKEIEVLLSDSGITKTYLLEQTKQVIEKIDAKDSDKLRAIETLMKISGLLNTDKKSESVALIQEFTGFSKEKLNAFKTGVLPSGEEN